MQTFILNKHQAIQIFENIKDFDVVFLSGDLASGKTTLVANIVKSLNPKCKPTSPTFSLQNVYEISIDFKIFHYDFYQNTYDKILQNGLFESFFEEGLHFVEWGDENLKNFLKKYEIKFCEIKIAKIDNKNKRKYEIFYE